MLTLVIPCYNEADNVPKLEREFVPVMAELAQTRSVEVIFVDDGCTDDTVAALQKAFGAEKRWAVRIERHGRNRVMCEADPKVAAESAATQVA